VHSNEEEKTIEEFLNNGELLYNVGQYGELAQLCREFLENLSDDRVCSMLSSAEYALGNYSAAEKSAREGLDINSKNPDNLLNLAYILYNKGSYSNALRYFERARKIGGADISNICAEDMPKLEEITNKTVAELLPEKARRRVLIIAMIFPPESGSGAQRTVKLVKYLRFFGWEPVVVTLPINRNLFFTGYEYFDELPDDIEVIRIPFKLTLNELDVERMKDRLVAMLSERTREEFESVYNRSDLQKKFELCWFPEPLVFWAYTVAECIGSYVDMSTIDIVYSTSGPYCDHFAGYYIKQQYQLPWVADFRDEWSNNPVIWLDKKNLQYRMCLDCERTIINSAEHMICVTERSLENYLKLGFPDSKLSCITNGFDEEDFEGINDESAANEKFTIIHNGLLYYDRTPMTILTALKNLIDINKIDAGKIAFHMGCFKDKADNDELENDVKRMTLDKVAFVTPYMEHRESLAHAASANLLILLLGPSKSYAATYPAKIFEYLRLSKPILSLGPDKSIIQELLNNTGHGINVNFTDVTLIESVILQYYRAWLEKIDGNALIAADVSAYERKSLVGRHAETFEKAVASPVFHIDNEL